MIFLKTAHVHVRLKGVCQSFMTWWWWNSQASELLLAQWDPSPPWRNNDVFYSYPSIVIIKKHVCMDTCAGFIFQCTSSCQKDLNVQQCPASPGETGRQNLGRRRLTAAILVLPRVRGPIFLFKQVRQSIWADVSWCQLENTSGEVRVPGVMGGQQRHLLGGFSTVNKTEATFLNTLDCV